ncbi:MAG TPA: hypothetical protein PLW39_02795 [Thermoflexales bacterium]|nr:hypothetical protein [Thermoflexales bacterium]HQZ21176.1 hypothetical protein [Thermoflexales bacterium]
MTTIKDHVIHLGNDGLLKQEGISDWRTTPDELREMINVTMPAVMRDWPRKRVAFYAHGGMNDSQSGMDHAAVWRKTFLDAQIYPIFFIWRSGFFDSLANALAEMITRSAREQMDDWLEQAGRPPVKPIWDEMKENALLASAQPQGGARQTAQLLGQNGQAAGWEFHLVGHSAGGILLAPFAQLLACKAIGDGPLAGETGYGLGIKTAALWAPGITSDFFKRTYISLLRQNALQKLRLYTLSDEAERKDTLRQVYSKSILYYVSNALEEVPRWDADDGCSIVGMAKFADHDPEIAQCVAEGHIHRVTSPLTEHLAFSRDPVTLAETIDAMW